MFNFVGGSNHEYSWSTNKNNETTFYCIYCMFNVVVHDRLAMMTLVVYYRQEMMSLPMRWRYYKMLKIKMRIQNLPSR